MRLKERIEILPDGSTIKDYVEEKDPNGLTLKTAGAKADEGKVSVTRGCLHYFPRALTEVARLSTIGANKYSWKGWEKVADGIHRYGDALGRHELKIEDCFTKRDSDTGVLEATAVAWNALARLELILRQQEPSGGAILREPEKK
jgi:hypothetical protein